MNAGNSLLSRGMSNPVRGENSGACCDGQERVGWRGTAGSEGWEEDVVEVFLMRGTIRKSGALGVSVREVDYVVGGGRCGFGGRGCIAIKLVCAAFSLAYGLAFS